MWSWSVLYSELNPEIQAPDCSDYCLSFCCSRQAPMCGACCSGGGSVPDLQVQSHSMRHQGAPWGHKLSLGSQHHCWGVANIKTELQHSQCNEGSAELLSTQKTNRRTQVLGLQLPGRVKTPLCLSSCYRRSESINLGWILILNLNIKVYWIIIRLDWPCYINRRRRGGRRQY